MTPEDALSKSKTIVRLSPRDHEIVEVFVDGSKIAIFPTHWLDGLLAEHQKRQAEAEEFRNNPPKDTVWMAQPG